MIFGGGGGGFEKQVFSYFFHDLVTLRALKFYSEVIETCNKFSNVIFTVFFRSKKSITECHTISQNNFMEDQKNAYMCVLPAEKKIIK